MEPEISPLAKRLAEENNVNWRGLNGSGADGRILERDVLEYLARVMAGDEALDPTPEPVPDGMEAWPEEDTQGYVADSSSASAPSPEWSDAAATQTESPDVELDDMIFDAPSRVSDEPVEISASSSGDAVADIDDDMFLFGEDEASTPEVPSMNANAGDMGAEAAADTLPADTLQTDTLQTDTLQTDARADADATPTFGANTLDTPSYDALNADVDIDDLDDLDDLEFDEDVASLFVDDLDDDADNSLSLDAPDLVSADVESADLGAVNPAPTTDEAPNFSLDDDFSFDKPAKASEDLLDHVMPPAETPPAAPDTPNVAGMAGMGAAAAAAAAGAFGMQQAQTEAHGEAEALTADAHVDAEVVTPAEHIAEIITEPHEPAHLEAETSVHNDVGEVAVPAAPTGTAQFVSYGTLLRRHVDMSALVQAQTDVAKELDQNEATVLSALILRACAKAMQSASLGRDGKLGVADLSDSGISLSSVDNVAEQGFAALVRDVQNANAGAADELALVVVDMSTSGVDEAVLNIDVPVLTIGRSLFDSTEGTHRSTISLSGDIGVESGSKFIAAVADLLDTPIRLVL